MRLIDADALTEKKYTDKECSGCGEASAFRCGWNDAIDTICENAPTIKPKTKVVAQVTFDEDKMREIAHETVERFKEEYDIVDNSDAVSEWIPCSERLPEDSGDYLVCPSDSVLEDYSDFSEVMIMPYDADCEAFGWWTERYNPISLGYLDSDFNESEVLAWMPLPEPWEGADDEKPV